MCPYAVSITGTAIIFVTTINAVIMLDIISQVSYLTNVRTVVLICVI